MRGVTPGVDSYANSIQAILFLFACIDTVSSEIIFITSFATTEFEGKNVYDISVQRVMIEGKCVIKLSIVRRFFVPHLRFSPISFHL